MSENDFDTLDNDPTIPGDGHSGREIIGAEVQSDKGTKSSSLKWVVMLLVVVCIAIVGWIVFSRSSQPAQVSKPAVIENKTEQDKEAFAKLISQAKLLSEQGLLDKAIETLGKAMELSPQDLEAKKLLAELETRREQLKKKQETEKKSKFEQLMQQARANNSKETAKKGLEAVEKALALYPEDSDAVSLKKELEGYLEPKLGDQYTNNLGMKLVYIPAGVFDMGSADGDSDEKPVHKVQITKGFYMGQYEVTQAQYESVMGSNPSYFKGENNPVEEVSWEEAVAFCKKLSSRENKTYRLPTEAEWEYACRAGSTTKYCFGDSESQLGDYAWNDKNSNFSTHPVGQKQQNNWGLYDMHGNVYEWCQDWYGENYYSGSPAIDP